MRQFGKVTFSDLIHILNPNHHSPFRLDHTVKEQLYYRLDARYDHWLFDEFQDTSRTQWEIIEDLVDEAIQDTERTAFLLGTQNNHCIFGEIVMIDYFNRSAITIKMQ